MESLNELEKRVLDIVQKNRELQQEAIELKAERDSMLEKCEKLEASLMDRTENKNALETEKASVKETIEELLSTISSIETVSR